MATRNIVPRANGEGGIGTPAKHWGNGYFDNLSLAGEDVAGTLSNMDLALAESTGYGIVSGCEPTISGLTVTVGAGVVHLADGTRKEIASTTVTLDAADSTNPRIDLVYITSAGEVAKVTGTAAESPSAPSVPSNGISVCTVSVAANASTGTVNRVQTIAPKIANLGRVNVKDFGAKGDGIHDDTAAIQAAINSGRYVYFPWGTYKLTDTIKITNKWDYYDKRGFFFDGKLAEFIYTGNNVAFFLSGVENAYFDFGVVKSPNGGNIELYATGNYDYIQYVEIHFNLLSCNANHANVRGHRSAEMGEGASMHGWLNEIRWYGGRFINPAKYNFQIEAGCNCWLFQHIGFESNDASTVSVLFDSTIGGIGQFVFYYCRHEETMDKFIKCIGDNRINKVYIYDYIEFDFYRITYTSKCDQWKIYTWNDCTSAIIKGKHYKYMRPKYIWGGLVISTVTDFDTIKEPGEYIFDEYNVINQCPNKPVAAAGRLTVENLSSYRESEYAGPLIQTFVTRTGDIYIRQVATNQAWKKITMS
jgi:hypothetical protein